MDKRLTQEDYIVFEAGTHTDAIKLNDRGYEQIVKPRVEDLAINVHPIQRA
jgi:prolyl-tRNA editing enzyme YbaK/EbsC (Cys-tRNA(Pro) deacylase)